MAIAVSVPIDTVPVKPPINPYNRQADGREKLVYMTPGFYAQTYQVLQGLAHGGNCCKSRLEFWPSCLNH